MCFSFQLFCQSADEAGTLSVLELNNSQITVFNVTSLRKFVVYNIQVSAFTAAGDGALSIPTVSARTLEDGNVSMLFS